MNYNEQLQTKQWKDLRLKVLEEYGNRCCGCGNPDTLQVHHLTYKHGRKAWEYDISDLIVLCNNCHKVYHENKTKLENILTHHHFFYSEDCREIINTLESITLLTAANVGKVHGIVNNIIKTQIMF